MATRKQTAEQKLLKMIETSVDSDDLSTRGSAGVSSGQGIALLAKGANKFLIFAAIVLALFFFNEFKNGMQFSPAKINKLSAGLDSRKVNMPENKMATIQRVSYYLAGISSRNIFEPYKAPVVSANVEVNEMQNEVADKIRDLKLVGISWMDKVSTASVMIEDTAKGVTYFLKKDESIDNIVVKTIYAESVELGYENEEIIITYDKTQM